MSDTPRTDMRTRKVLSIEGIIPYDAVPADFARELEQELNTVTRLWKAASIKLGEQRALEIASGTPQDNAPQNEQKPAVSQDSPNE